MLRCKPSERESLLNIDHINLCDQVDYVTKRGPAMLSTLREFKGSVFLSQKLVYRHLSHVQKMQFLDTL